MTTATLNAESTRHASSDLPRRTQAVLAAEVDFSPNAEFEASDAAGNIATETDSITVDSYRDGRLPANLPGHLARLCESKLLSAEEETRLFRRMNYLKFRVVQVREGIDPNEPREEAVEEAEACLREAEAIRDRIVRSNMRLVMSVVKKFVTPQLSFDEMLSDGIFSLMQAIEKFDYDRGFRFSTYAYRAIARNAFRRINDYQKENARFASTAEDAVFDVQDERESSSVKDQAGEHLRGLLPQMMDRLDRRERFIIRSRYALGAHRRVRTFQFLADKLGVSKERVRQLCQRALTKLQNFAAEQQLEEVISPVLG